MPLLSLLLPVGPRTSHLDKTLASLHAQTDPGWELVAVVADGPSDDARRLLARAARTDTRVTVLDASPATGPVAAGNDALKRARAPWVAFLEPGDELHRDAVARIAGADRADDPEFIYTDEDTLDASGAHIDPWYKPGWSPDLLRAQHYTGGIAAFRRDLLARIGGLRAEVEGAHHHDLALRAGEQAAGVTHLASVLYHRRGSRPPASDAGVRAIADHLTRTGVPATVAADDRGTGLYRLTPRLEAHPLISIVVPTACQPRQVGTESQILVVRCIESILEHSTYDHYEIVCVVDDNADEAGRAALELAGGDRLRIVPYSLPFHFARKINTGVLASRGKFVVLLNDDTEVRTPGWLEHLLMYAQLDGVGAVGARLLFADGRIQHGGIAAVRGRAGHCYYGLPGDQTGYFYNALVPMNLLGVTAACLMTRRGSFEEVGGLSADFPVNYNDVDFCLKLRHAGYRIVCNPEAELWHLEAATRRTGAVDRRELDTLHDRWGYVLNHDPYYNPHFLPTSVDFITPVYLPDGTPVPPPEPVGLYWMR